MSPRTTTRTPGRSAQPTRSAQSSRSGQSGQPGRQHRAEHGNAEHDNRQQSSRQRSNSPHRSTSNRRPAPAARRAERSEWALALDAAAALPAAPAPTFHQLGLPQPLITVLARRGVAEPFAIQTRVLPDALAGRDILGRAQTGSGKTLAFGLPLLTRLAASGEQRRPLQPSGLILVPTRELARQVADELAPLGQPLGLRVGTVYGGASMSRQIETLRRGLDVIVATPGRLIDLIERKAANLDRISITVLDEADHMADLGFLPDVRKILDATPAGGQRMLLSATLDGGVELLVRDYLSEPAVHAVAQSLAATQSLDHQVFTVRHDEKVAVAAEIAARPARTLFFVRTKHGADRLAKQLDRAGVPAAAIHGNLSQGQRQRALDGFSAGLPRVLVATDVAARGIHVDDVDLVVHFDLPNDHKDYLHRSGRTARAGASGTVLAFAEPGQAREVARLHTAADVTASTAAVHTGHSEVRRLAESGTPVVVREPAVREESARPSGGRPDGRGPRAAGGSGRPRRARRPIESNGRGGRSAGAH